VLAVTALNAPAASADQGAEVIHPECGFTAGHFPEVDVEIVAFTCQVVLTPGGPVNAHSRAWVPEGYSVAPGVYRDGACRSVVTPTGLITTNCAF
jgi:hypothetical protein